MRTRQTAGIMNRFHNCKIIKEELLNELDKGILARRHKDSFTQKENEARKLCLKAYGVETRGELLERCKAFVEKLKTFPHKNVLIVTHSAPATFIYYLLINLPQNEILKHRSEFTNAEVRKVVI